MASVPLFGSEMLDVYKRQAALLFRFSMTNQFGAVGYEQIVRVAHREIPL